jgi:hypothetical protein
MFKHETMSKTKEETIREQFNLRRMANPLDGQDTPIVHSAMDEYAEQQAIEFAKWICSHKLDFQPATNQRWIGLNMEYVSNEQLYQIFLKEKINV